MSEQNNTPNQEKYLISEFYNLTVDKNLIKEAEEQNLPITLTGILQKSNTLNRNGRVYPTAVLKREAKKYEEMVKDRRALSELDHPDSPVISLAKVSHLVTEMWWEGDTLMGRIELLNTPSGQVAKDLVKSGVMLGISSRGVGSVKKIHESDVVQDDFELIAFDLVSSPSTPGAYLFKEGYRNGMRLLTQEDFKSSHDKETPTVTIATVKSVTNDKFQKLLNISKEDFWNKG